MSNLDLTKKIELIEEVLLRLFNKVNNVRYDSLERIVAHDNQYWKARNCAKVVEAIGNEAHNERCIAMQEDR